MWICSYIGLHGDRSAERRQQAETARRDVAEYLGLDPAAPAQPTEAGVFSRIVDRRLWTPAKGGGKSVELRKHSTAILIDDRLDVREEAERAGVLTYAVDHHTSLPAVVDTLIADYQTGALFDRVSRAWDQRVW